MNPASPLKLEFVRHVSVYMEQRREHIEQLSDLLIDVPSIPHSTLKVG